MSLTQFAMVEELAFLVKDNLPCKHLVLSMEEALVNFLKDDTCPDGVIELEPMNSYSRLLLHRLADIFGFAHESVGEGDNRHLILERCSETSIPSILVSDILFQNDEPQSSITPHQLLRRYDSPSGTLVSVLKAKSPTLHTLEEREAAYLAARERIFSIDVEEMREPIKQKPRSDPVVARRMIAHALGQKISPGNLDAAVTNVKECEVQTNGLNVQDEEKDDPNCSSEASQHNISSHGKNISSSSKAKNSNRKSGVSSHGQKNLSQKPAERTSTSNSVPPNGTSRNGVKKEYSKEQHLGAAKRMFAHALGLNSVKGVLGRCSETKQLDIE